MTKILFPRTHRPAPCQCAPEPVIIAGHTYFKPAVDQQVHLRDGILKVHLSARASTTAYLVR